MDLDVVAKRQHGLVTVAQLQGRGLLASTNIDDTLTERDSRRRVPIDASFCVKTTYAYETEPRVRPTIPPGEPADLVRQRQEPAARPSLPQAEARLPLAAPQPRPCR